MTEVKYTQISGKDSQVGGDHYLYAIQPAEFIAQNKIGFLEGNAIKHLVRHHRKGGLEDLKKAIHYIQLLAEASYSTQVHTIFLEGEEAKTKVKIGVLREVEAPAKYTAYVESDPTPEPRGMLNYLKYDKNLSNRQIALKLGCSYQTVSRWFYGGLPKRPTKSFLKRLTKLYLDQQS